MKIAINSGDNSIEIELTKTMLGDMAEVLDSAAQVQLKKLSQSTCVHEHHTCCNKAEKLLHAASLMYKELGV